MRVNSFLKMSPNYFDDFLNNNEEGIKSFYDDQWPKCERLIGRLGGQNDDAADIMQSAMTALFINVRSGRYQPKSETSMSSYFLQICKYLWFDVRKSAHHRKTKSIDEGDQLDISDVELNVEELIEVRDRQLHVQKLMKLLDLRCRELLHAFYWKKESLSNIAERLNLTSGSAKTQKYRCLQKLRKHMAENKTSQYE